MPRLACVPCLLPWLLCPWALPFRGAAAPLAYRAPAHPTSKVRCIQKGRPSRGAQCSLARVLLHLNGKGNGLGLAVVVGSGCRGYLDLHLVGTLLQALLDGHLTSLGHGDLGIARSLLEGKGSLGGKAKRALQLCSGDGLLCGQLLFLTLVGLGCRGLLGGDGAVGLVHLDGQRNGDVLGCAFKAGGQGCIVVTNMGSLNRCIAYNSAVIADDGLVAHQGKRGDVGVVAVQGHEVHDLAGPFLVHGEGQVRNGALVHRDGDALVGRAGGCCLCECAGGVHRAQRQCEGQYGNQNSRSLREACILYILHNAPFRFAVSFCINPFGCIRCLL